MGMRVIYLRSHRQAPPWQHRAGREARRAAGAERHRQPARAGDAGDRRHDRREGAAGDEAGLLPDQQQPRHGGRSRCARRARCATAISRVPPSTCFRSSPPRIRTASKAPCRASATSSSRRISAARPKRRRSASAAKWRASWSTIHRHGSTMGAVNFPQVQLHSRPSGTRFSHVHRNVPGMLRRLNEVFLAARHQHRRAISGDRRRPRLRRARRRSRRPGFRRAAGADPRARRHDPARGWCSSTRPPSRYGCILLPRLSNCRHLGVRQIASNLSFSCVRVRHGTGRRY